MRYAYFPQRLYPEYIAISVRLPARPVAAVDRESGFSAAKEKTLAIFSNLLRTSSLYPCVRAVRQTWAGRILIVEPRLSAPCKKSERFR